MIRSLSMIILGGLSVSKLFQRIHIPGLLGMLLLGILIGPYGVNILSEDILYISGDLRKIALIIILIRAGLGIKGETLKQVGIPAVKMSIIPALMEGFTIMIVAHLLFKFSLVEGGILGFVLAAVSPAVIVPSMLNFIKDGRGEEKGIPTLILAGASMDDIVAITIFSSFLGFYGGNKVNILFTLFQIPLSIVLGIALGLGFSFLLLKAFKNLPGQNTTHTLLLLAVAMVITEIEAAAKDFVPIAGLLGVMALGFVLAQKNQKLAQGLSASFSKIWNFAQLLLFVLVGAQVNLSVALDSGFQGILLIFLGLFGRSLGVLLSIQGAHFTGKEKLFCIIAYVPKATVQAAIGAVPLAAGVKSGELILALAVLSILITAPLGAIGIRIAGDQCLSSTTIL